MDREVVEFGTRLVRALGWNTPDSVRNLRYTTPVASFAPPVRPRSVWRAGFRLHQGNQSPRASCGRRQCPISFQLRLHHLPRHCYPLLPSSISNGFHRTAFRLGPRPFATNPNVECLPGSQPTCHRGTPFPSYTCTTTTRLRQHRAPDERNYFSRSRTSARLRTWHRHRAR